MENKTTQVFENANENFQDLFVRYKGSVTNAYPSIYTKDDVSHLLDDLLHDSKKLLTHAQQDIGTPDIDFDWDDLIDGVYDEVLNSVNKKIKECYEIDSDECELSLDYNNTIVVENVAISFDKENLSDYITTGIKNYLNAKLRPQPKSETQNS